MHATSRLTIASAVLTILSATLCRADDNLSFEIILDVGLVDFTPYGGDVYMSGDFAIDGAIQDEGGAVGQYVSMPDGTLAFQLMLSGQHTDWQLDIQNVQGELGPGFSVIYSSDNFTLAGVAGDCEGVTGSGTASGYTYYSDETGGWGDSGQRENWSLTGELTEPLPPPTPAPMPEFAIDDVSIVEGDRGTRHADFTVALSAPSEDTITVEYVTEDGTARVSNRDYYAASGVLTFQLGQTIASIAIAIRGDHKRESDETFFVYLGNPIGAVLADDEGVGTILNDD